MPFRISALVAVAAVMSFGSITLASAPPEPPTGLFGATNPAVFGVELGNPGVGGSNTVRVNPLRAGVLTVTGNTPGSRTLS